MIPKRIHWIWLGDAPVPPIQREWIREWRRRHEGWEATIWTDQSRPRLVNERLFLRARNRVQQSDILRFEILYRFGGVYLDTDVECLQNIDSLVKDCEAFAGQEQSNVLGSAVLGAAPRHPWVAALLEEVCIARFFREGQSHETGPMLITKVTDTRDDVTVFPQKLFYSKTWEKPGETDADAFAVHHWYGSWAYSPPSFSERISYRLRSVVPTPVVRAVVRVRHRLRGLK